MEQVAIFASGGGSNAQVIIDYFKSHPSIKVNLIVTNNAAAFVLERAKKVGISTFVHNAEDVKNGNLIQKLEENHITFIVLAGYLKMISKDLAKKYANRMINIHPALLPNYGGKGMYGMNVHKVVYQNKEKESGITIHYVNEHYDEGQIIAQHTCDISGCESAEAIQKRVLELEHKHFAPTIEKLLV